MKISFLVSFLIFFFLNGAIFAEGFNYIQHPKFNAQKEDGCTSISGGYQFIGESLNPLDLGKVRIDFAFFYREVIGEPSRVELFYDKAAETLAVTFLGENIHPAENVKFLMKAQCVNGEIIYDVSHNGYSDGTEHNVKATIRFSKDMQGNLIAKKISQVINTEFLIFSRARQIKADARFRQIEQKEEQKGAEEEQKGSASQ